MIVAGRCAFVLVLLLTSPLAAQQRIGREQTLHPTTQAGQPVRVFTYVTFDSACNPRQAPQIVVRAAPQHGTVAIQPGSSVVRVLRQGAADCTGHVIPGTSLYYTPLPGFRGTDQFEYDVLEQRDMRHDTAIVEVR